MDVNKFQMLSDYFSVFRQFIILVTFICQYFYFALTLEGTRLLYFSIT